jgi:hypothetical protein
MRSHTVVFALLSVLTALSAVASQPLETETARLLPKGVLKFEATAEFQTSNAGAERAFPLLFEYGITDRTELAVEPVLGTSIHPKNGPTSSGFGDIEITLTHLLRPESASAPAFAVAGEVKLPTANNRRIGTGKADYSAYAIASKRFGRLDTHANLGYTVVGSPSGTNLKNIVDYALAEEFHLNPQYDIVGEVIGHTSSTGEVAEGSVTDPNLPPEAAGAENVVLLGLRYHFSPALVFAVGVTYDNNHALLIRPGITYRFGAH